jgi:hypothetical protein
MPPGNDPGDTASLRHWAQAARPVADYEVPIVTHIEEEKVTTTREEVDPPKPNVTNLNVNTNGETITVDQTPDETGDTRTTTTHTEVRKSD